MAENKDLKKSGGHSHYEGLSWAVIVALFCIPFTQPLGLLMLFIKLWSGGGKKDDKKLTAGERRQFQEAARKYTPVDRPVIDLEPAAELSASPQPQHQSYHYRWPPKKTEPHPESETPPPAKPASAPKQVQTPPEKKPPAVKEAARSLTRTPRTSGRKATLLKIVGTIALISGVMQLGGAIDDFIWLADLESSWMIAQATIVALAGGVTQIGRASCRERV